MSCALHAPHAEQFLDFLFKQADRQHRAITFEKALHDLSGYDGIRFMNVVHTLLHLLIFDNERKNAIRVPLGRVKVAVLKLERIIESKKSLGRQKDKLVLPVLD